MKVDLTGDDLAEVLRLLAQSRRKRSTPAQLMEAIDKVVRRHHGGKAHAKGAALARAEKKRLSDAEDARLRPEVERRLQRPRATQRAVAKHLGISRQRVSRIAATILAPRKKVARSGSE